MTQESISAVMEAEREINEVKERHATELFKIPGVVGVGVERDEHGRYVLVIHVESYNAELVDLIPKELEGHRVKILHSGSYAKLPSERLNDLA